MKATSKAKKQRLDVLLVERGLAESRQRAQALILAGQALVNGQKVDKAGAQVADDSAIQLLGEPMPYASRGGLKLAGALDDFGVSPSGLVCLDVGSSTGGFTDCLLQRGAGRVYAVDVNTAQLAWKLQRDPRVVRVKCNARNVTSREVPEAAAFATMDVSFISVSKVLPAFVKLLVPGAAVLVLVKPQFELEKREVGKGGIVRDAKLHEKAIERASAAAQSAGLAVLGMQPSRIAGAEGNLEFFLHAQRAAIR